VLYQPRQEDLELFQALQSDGGSRSPRARAAPADLAALADVIDTIRRSPLMLDLPASQPGLEALVQIVSLSGVQILGCNASGLT